MSNGKAVEKKKVVLVQPATASNTVRLQMKISIKRNLPKLRGWLYVLQWDFFHSSVVPQKPSLHFHFSFKFPLFSWQPENILCVNRDTYQIKIIDFGLARRYVHIRMLYIINKLCNIKSITCLCKAQSDPLQSSTAFETRQMQAILNNHP